VPPSQLQKNLEMFEVWDLLRITRTFLIWAFSEQQFVPEMCGGGDVMLKFVG